MEHLLTEIFVRRYPTAIGNRYLVIGTLERKACREGTEEPLSIEEIRAHTHDFKTHYQELRLRQQGWFLAGEVPPIREPPPSEEWVKPEGSAGGP